MFLAAFTSRVLFLDEVPLLLERLPHGDRDEETVVLADQDRHGEVEKRLPRQKGDRGLHLLDGGILPGDEMAVVADEPPDVRERLVDGLDDVHKTVEGGEVEALVLFLAPVVTPDQNRRSSDEEPKEGFRDEVVVFEHAQRLQSSGVTRS